MAQTCFNSESTCDLTVVLASIDDRKTVARFFDHTTFSDLSVSRNLFSKNRGVKKTRDLYRSFLSRYLWKNIPLNILKVHDRRQCRCQGEGMRLFFKRICEMQVLLWLKF